MTYDGGKGGAGVAQWIINHMPPHSLYVEPFLGAGAVVRVKRPAARSIGVEVNPRTIADHWSQHGVPGLTVISGDGLEVLRGGFVWPADTFIYCDPPYLMSTRSNQRQLYAFEYAESDEHRALLALLRSLPFKIAISGYWSELYELELSGWRVDTFQTVKRSGASATEYLWMNYPAPLELHDYRHLGSNFRERERIKRKQRRWRQMLADMPAAERYAMFAAIEEARASIASGGDEIPVNIAAAGEPGRPRQQRR